MEYFGKIKMVSRVQLFCQRFTEVEDYLGKAQKKFDAVKTLLSPSGQSIVNAANRLVQLGAKEDSARKVALPKADVGQQEELLNSFNIFQYEYLKNRLVIFT